jgi:hypothetical protein
VQVDLKESAKALRISQGWGCGWRVRVSGFGSRFSGFGFSGFGFQVSGFGFRVSGSGFKARGVLETLQDFFSPYETDHHVAVSSCAPHTGTGIPYIVTVHILVLHILVPVCGAQDGYIKERAGCHELCCHYVGCHVYGTRVRGTRLRYLRNCALRAGNSVLRYREQRPPSLLHL